MKNPDDASKEWRENHTTGNQPAPAGMPAATRRNLAWNLNQRRRCRQWRTPYHMHLLDGFTISAKHIIKNLPKLP